VIGRMSPSSSPFSRSSSTLVAYACFIVLPAMAA
jgi:hypothetical protein